MRIKLRSGESRSLRYGNTPRSRARFQAINYEGVFYLMIAEPVSHNTADRSGILLINRKCVFRNTFVLNNPFTDCERNLFPLIKAAFGKRFIRETRPRVSQAIQRSKRTHFHVISQIESALTKPTEPFQ